MSFKIHDKDSAPEGSRAALETVERSFGFIPNMLGILAEAPAALKGYITLSALLEETSFDALERQAILLAASSQNGCDYCTAERNALMSEEGISPDLLEAIRSGRPTKDERLNALLDLTRAVVSERGWVSDDEVRRFFDAGYSRAQLLEILVGVALKTLSNYANHIAQTPLDGKFRPFANRRRAA